MNNPLVFPIILQVIGIIIIMVEVLIPTGGLLALLATAAFGYSLYSVFSSFPVTMGVGFIIADLIIIPVIVISGFKFLAKSPVTLKKELSSAQGVNVQKRDINQYIGEKGRAMTDLRPSGIAVINKERLDVVTEGKYLDKDTPIIVIAVTGNQIIVKEN